MSARGSGSRCAISQTALAGLGPVEEPADLPLRIRVAVSQERARSRRSIFTMFDLVWRNTVGPFLLQAGAGFASAVLLLGTIVFLVSMLAKPETARPRPTSRWAMPPRRICSISPMRPAAMKPAPSTVPSWLRSASTMRARCTTTALSPDRPTPPRALKSRICCCSAALRRPASSASRFADWPCCRSPASPCEDKNREQKKPLHERRFKRTQ